MSEKTYEEREREITDRLKFNSGTWDEAIAITNAFKELKELYFAEGRRLERERIAEAVSYEFGITNFVDKEKVLKIIRNEEGR